MTGIHALAMVTMVALAGSGWLWMELVDGAIRRALPNADEDWGVVLHTARVGVWMTALAFAIGIGLLFAITLGLLPTAAALPALIVATGATAAAAMHQGRIVRNATRLAMTDEGVHRVTLAALWLKSHLLVHCTLMVFLYLLAASR